MSSATAKKQSQEIIAISIHEVSTKFNIRHGWNTPGMSEAYLEGIEGLITSIQNKGFKPSEPLEVYLAEDGKTYLKEGHRRFSACNLIMSRDENAILAKLPTKEKGMVWVVYVDPPTDMLELVVDQFDANRSQGNTILDEARAYSEALNSPMADVKGKELTRTEKVKILSKRFDKLSSTIKNLVEFYEKMDPKILDWIQDGLINQENERSVILTYNSANQLAIAIGFKQANAVLLDVQQRVIKQKYVELYGRSIKSSWLHDLAKKMFPPVCKENSVTEVEAGEENSEALDGFSASVNSDSFIQKHEDDAQIHGQIIKLIYENAAQFFNPDAEIAYSVRHTLSNLIKQLGISNNLQGNTSETEEDIDRRAA